MRRTFSLTDNVPTNTTFVSMSQTAGPAFTLNTPAVGATGTATATGLLLSARPRRPSLSSLE